MRHVDEPWAACALWLVAGSWARTPSKPLEQMVSCLLAHLWLHACRKAMRIATQRPWYEHNAELSDLPEAATRRGADYAMISTTAGG